MKKQIVYHNTPFNWVLTFIVGMIGYNLNNYSVFWGIIDGIFYPVAIIKWLIYEELTLTLIKDTFPFFFQ